MKHASDIAKEFMGTTLDQLDPVARRVVSHVASKTHLAKAPDEANRTATRGEVAADVVAKFGGSWIFISLFAAVLVAWVIVNAALLFRYGHTFDPYPYILLNLFLSMLASVQAPILLMSQNRQNFKDRENAEHDYEINLRAELEIMMLHQKIDRLRDQQWSDLVEMQNAQLLLLRTLVDPRFSIRKYQDA